MKNSEDLIVCRGFRFAGVPCGLKKKDGELDLALLFSETPATAAAVFTTNLFAAAPVLHGRRQLAAGKPLRAVLINSGNANACTGPQGEVDVLAVAEVGGAALQLEPAEIFISSTGVIGEPLPVTKILNGIEKLVGALDDSVAARGPEAFMRAARAIMTTDNQPKTASRSLSLAAGTVTISGLAKGAGMIQPKMATMLSYLLTDAKIEAALWQEMLARVVDQTFNRITVDGDMSTNDTVLALANGAAEVELTAPADLEAFEKALLEVARDLALMIVRDGEGASKMVEIRVIGAPSPAVAEKICRAVGNSALVKTAFYGQDANWGRIVAAIGYAGVDFKPELVNLDLDEVRGVSGGLREVAYREEMGATVLKKREFVVKIDLQLGEDQYFIFTSDLTHEYVSINADYRS